MTFSGRGRRTARLLAWALLALSAAGCSGAKQNPPPAPVGTVQQPPGERPGAGGTNSEAQPFPGYKAADVAATDVNTGKALTLSALKGRVVMLNFWATWCGPCRVEMPAMEAFQNEAQQRVRVIALGGDSGEAPEKLAAFARELKLTFTVAHDGGAAILPYRVLGLPTTVFIDQNGVIRARHTGPLTIEQMRQLAADTEQMGKQQ